MSFLGENTDKEFLAYLFMCRKRLVSIKIL